MYQERSTRRFGTVVPMLLAAMGTYILLVGNSRGPLIAAICCLLIMVVALRTTKKLAAILVLAVAAVLLSPIMAYVEKTTDIAVYSRMFGQSISEQAESSMRLSLYKSALQITESSPFIGVSIEDPWTKSYPHNVFIELYMASGLFAAAGLLVIFILLMVRAIKLLGYRSSSSWAGILFIQFLVGAQVSSAFYSNGYLWCAVGLLIAAQPVLPPTLTGEQSAKRE
jgi:O-antigen ligase